MKSKKGFVFKIYSKKDIKRIEEKLNLFGVNKKMEVEEFLKYRLYTTIIVFIACSALLGGIFWPIVFTISWYYLVYYLKIEKPLRKREEKLNKEAYYYFEVLTLALESGRNLENAIKMACQYIDSDISSEFKEILKEVNFGKSLTESLYMMSSRIPSLTINNIILNMEQSNLFGNSIIDTMYNQLDFLKEKQVMETKAKINKIPNKISIFSVIFFIPLLLLIILGPVLADFISK